MMGAESIGRQVTFNGIRGQSANADHGEPYAQ